MRGLLFYDSEGAKRNEWFIDRLIKSANDLGHELTLVIHPDQTDAALKITPDFAIIRTIDPHLNVRVEMLNIYTFNNHLTSYVANDKWKTYILAKKLGIPVMDTKDAASPDEAIDAMPFPFILKSVDGHGGSEVFMVENAEKCKELFSFLKDKRVIVQSISSEPGIDMRVYALGGEILAAVKRSSDVDFRSNFSLGGKAEAVYPEEDVKTAVKKICTSLMCDFVGVDFIRHEGKWVLNEIEDVVGTRMLYAKTDIDPAYEYIKYIIQKVT